jgi:hypothetical protein
VFDYIHSRPKYTCIPKQIRERRLRRPTRFLTRS